MNTKLKIYSDKSYILPDVPHTIMLFPFWGISSDVMRYAITYQKYAEIGTNFFDLTTLENADLIVAPVAWEKSIENRELILQLAQQASDDKPIVVFFWYPSEEEVLVPNSIIFRTSFYKSTQKPTEFAMPAWSDLQVGQEPLEPRTKSEIPVVGFCGYIYTRQMQTYQAGKDILRYIKDGVAKTRQKQLKRKYHIFRRKVLHKLSKSKLIETNFIIRKQFHGKVQGEQKKIEQQEYIDNIRNSDYGLCIRGAANVSFRLYEILYFGRIPVFINTDCVLPYDFEIDWKQYCVWIEEHELDQMDKKIREFHDNLSPEEFVNLQKKCRQIWEEYLSPEGFFKHLHKHFE